MSEVPASIPSPKPKAKLRLVCRPTKPSQLSSPSALVIPEGDYSTLSLRQRHDLLTEAARRLGLVHKRTRTAPVEYGGAVIEMEFLVPSERGTPYRYADPTYYTPGYKIPSY